jgi:hypothetical protein
VRRRQRRLTSTDNYGRKLKPTAKKTRKTRKNEENTKNPRKKRHAIMTVAASLALGMPAIMPGLIAGSALTKSAKQVPNVATQVSAATCAYVSGGDWNNFGICMAGIWGDATTYGALSLRATTPSALIGAVVRYVKANPWGLAVAVA